MHEIEDVGFQPGLLAYTSGAKLVSIGAVAVWKAKSVGIVGKHVNKADGNPQTIAHRCTSVFHYPGYNHPDVILLCLNSLSTLCDELI